MHNHSNVTNAAANVSPAGTRQAGECPDTAASVRYMQGRCRLPRWLKRPIVRAGRKAVVERELGAHRLHTVCAEARCPNRAECFARGTATFLIMGSRCTRDCGFCAVTHGTPGALDPDEPERISRTVRALGLSYVVITSVTRDDLADGGAGHFAAVVRRIKESTPAVRVEILVPDFGGSREALSTVLDSGPDVLNHNVETVPRLYPRIRPQADYHRSLELLQHAARFEPPLIVKSGLMAGVGERDDEVVQVLGDLHKSGCGVVTIGQYLQPSPRQAVVERFVDPQQFEQWEALGREMGFKAVWAGPFVRSSYMAADVFAACGESFAAALDRSA